MKNGVAAVEFFPLRESFSILNEMKCGLHKNSISVHKVLFQKCRCIEVWNVESRDFRKYLKTVSTLIKVLQYQIYSFIHSFTYSFNHSFIHVSCSCHSRQTASWLLSLPIWFLSFWRDALHAVLQCSSVDSEQIVKNKSNTKKACTRQNVALSV